MIIHDYGPGRTIMSLHAEVPSDCDIMAVHDTIDGIEMEIRERYHILTVIHMDPIAMDDASVEMRITIAALVRSIHPELTIHDFRMTAGPKRTNLIFDVVLPTDLRGQEADITAALEKALNQNSGVTYYPVITFDQSGFN